MKKTILVISNDGMVKSIINSFKLIKKDWEFINIENINELNNTSSKHIDMIIVDYSSMNNRTLLSKAIKDNKEIETLVINDKYKYNYEYDCEYCKKNYKRKRISNFHDMRKFFTYLDKFSTLKCEFQSDCNITELAIQKLIFDMKCFKYNKNSKTISKEDFCTTTSAIKEVVEISARLKREKIPFNLVDNFSFEILD
jgi:hypothetical protein